MSRSNKVLRATAAVIFSLVLSAWTHHKIYDPDRDPARDLAAAKIEAARNGKKILLSVGGNWCSWCLAFDRFLHENPFVKQRWDETFVTVKVNVSDENRNEKFLAQYPRVSALPLLFVLDSDGTLIDEQRTGVFEQGKSYSQDRLLEFVDQWHGETKSLRLAEQK